jgi:hypothetical protein
VLQCLSINHLFPLNRYKPNNYYTHVEPARLAFFSRATSLSSPLTLLGSLLEAVASIVSPNIIIYGDQMGDVTDFVHTLLG